ncbi:DoxX-like family protein [Bacillus sp. FJAT-26390]|uniref:DoxX-like family protein n=1 Tax=Bacillus sp. FJAT-26390 TaxID=1743142 RepID=UPI000807BEEB|nr:DoxX-like family protein [Bacillus sp. FJAT-26390]OBZ17348.1 hypothetical protein A7975_05600 [Bacillus sp. FJAT-26390]
MKNKPIYVELDIHTTLEELWEHTQSPMLHQQWDLRFSEISYLPKLNEHEKQNFLYETRIGFGLKIKGTGETSHSPAPSMSERLSVLSFASEQPVSLIRHGGGYWKYKVNNNEVTFMTLFDYRTRFGVAGRLLDRFIFRPLFGYATAWSFDRLRIWLEQKIPPSVTAERAITHYVSVIFIMLLWLYEGIVPKLLYPDAGELTLMKQVGWFAGNELLMVHFIGIGEVALGIISAIFHRKNGIYIAQILLLLVLTLPALLYDPRVLMSPFNPLTLALPMIGLCLIARWSGRHLPQASRCKRHFK